MKKPIALLLSLVLLLGALPPASAAETARGATIRLEKTEGTVTLSNQNGTELPAQKNSKLYNGYALETEAASYAYFALDDKKAVKLDQTSAVTVKKTGKKLELLVAAGQLFFNVSAPLAADETMEIRTSSMVTGIRGTSGVVAQLDATTSRFYLFSGSAVLTDTDPATGVQRQVTVHAGESALSRHITTADGNLGERVTLQGAMRPAEVPGFAATAIAADPALQKRIVAESSLNVTEIVNNAPQTLQQEQQQKKQETQQAERAENLRDNPPTLTTSTGDDGSSAPPIEPPVEPPIEPLPPTPTETSLIASDVTEETLRTALANHKKVIITAGGLEAPTLKLTDQFEIPSGKTLDIGVNTLRTIEGGGPLINHGTLVLADPLSVGTFVNNGTVQGTLTLTDKFTMESGAVDTLQVLSGTIAVVNKERGRIAALKIEGADTKVAMTNRGSIGEITSTYTTALGGKPSGISFEAVGTIEKITNFPGGTPATGIPYGWSESGWVQATI